MIASGNDVYVIGPNRLFYNEIISLGIKGFIEVPLVKENTNPLGDLKYLKELKKCIRELKPDMVFGYTIKPVIYGSLAARSAGVPKIYSMVTGLGRVFSSGSIKTKVIRRITVTLYRRALKKCTKVIFQNPDDRDTLIRLGCLEPEKAELVNGSGVNMQRFSRDKKPEKINFLMVSRIIREKGVLEYCAASKIVKEKYPDVTFTLLGGFDQSIGVLQRGEFAEYVDSGVVELPGEVKDPVEYYRRCSVYVLPSYYREGLPRTILEAMACGCPVITTDWPGCREPIEDGKNGILVPIRDAGALAQAMLRLTEDRELTDKLSAAAYQTCKEKYDVRIVNEQMRKILQY